MTTTPGAPTATGHVDASPCPRIDASFTPVTGHATVTVYRSSSAGKDAVRGAVRKPVTAVGAMIVTDFEAPLGTPVTYTWVAYDSAGVPSAESAASNAVTLSVPAGCPWVIDPTNPSLAMQWTMTEWDSRTYQRNAAQLWPLVSDSAIVVTGRRSQPFSSPQVLTQDAASAATLRSLADTPVIQMRTPTSWYWRGGYFTIGDLTETAFYYDATAATQTWKVELIPASRPDPALFYPVYTWSDVLALYTTWGGLGAAKATWLAVQRNPDPGAV